MRVGERRRPGVRTKRRWRVIGRPSAYMPDISAAAFVRQVDGIAGKLKTGSRSGVRFGFFHVVVTTTVRRILETSRSMTGNDCPDNAARDADQQEVVVRSDPAIPARRRRQPVTAIVRNVRETPALCSGDAMSLGPTVLLNNDFLLLHHDGRAAMVSRACV